MENKKSLPIIRYCLRIFLDRLRKTVKTWVRIACFSTEAERVKSWSPKYEAGVLSNQMLLSI
jgi:hypothetical protein